MDWVSLVFVQPLFRILVVESVKSEFFRCDLGLQESISEIFDICVKRWNIDETSGRGLGESLVLFFRLTLYRYRDLRKALQCFFRDAVAGTTLYYLSACFTIVALKLADIRKQR